MATSVISNVLTDPSGTAVSGVTIVATLQPGPGFRVSDASEVTRRETTTSAAGGDWSLILERNSNISPTGTWWEIEEQVPAAYGGPRVWAISVGASNATLYASLVTPSSSTGLATYLTQASADARYASISSGVTDLKVKNVLDYGADPTGGSNSRSAFQAAVDAAAVATQRIVWVPAGTYVISGGSINCNDKPVTIMGVNDRLCILNGAGTAAVITHNNSTDTTGFTLIGVGVGHSPASSTINGVEISTSSLWTVERCSFGSCKWGLSAGVDARMGTITGNTFGSTNVRGLNLGAGASHNRIVGNWIDENTEYGLYANGSYNAIVANSFADNTTYSVYLDAAANNNVVVSNTFVAGGGLGTTRAFQCAGDYNRFSQNTVDDHTNEVVIVAGGASNSIEGNTFTAGSVSISDSGTSTRIKNNLGYNPQGVAAITVGASPYTYTAGATPEAVYISGGTVSAVSKNSTTVFAGSDVTVNLEPGEAVVVTYSVAPTMTKDRK